MIVQRMKVNYQQSELETPTIAKLKKRPSITIKRNCKKRKVYLIGKELTNQIEKIREKIRNKENKKIYISN